MENDLTQDDIALNRRSLTLVQHYRAGDFDAHNAVLEETFIGLPDPEAATLSGMQVASLVQLVNAALNQFAPNRETADQWLRLMFEAQRGSQP